MMSQQPLILCFAILVVVLETGFLLLPASSTTVSLTPTPEVEQRLIQQVNDALTLSPCDEAYYQQRLESLAQLLAAPEGKNISLERLEAIWEQGAYSMDGRYFGLALSSSDGDAVLAAMWCAYCVTGSHMPHGGVELSVIDRSGNAFPIERPITSPSYIRELTVHWMDDRWVALVNHDQGGADAPHSVWHITQNHGEWQASVQFDLLPAGSYISCGSFEFSGFLEGYQHFTASYSCVTMVPPCEYKEGYEVYGNVQHIATKYEWTGEDYQISNETHTYTQVAIRGIEEGKETYLRDNEWAAYCQD